MWQDDGRGDPLAVSLLALHLGGAGGGEARGGLAGARAADGRRLARATDRNAHQPTCAGAAASSGVRACGAAPD